MHLLLPLASLLLLLAGGGEAITCFTCSSKAGQPTWCSRAENKGPTKQCKGDSLNPANTCFKAVNKKTGEVSTGCAPTKYNHGINQKISTGFNGEPDVVTYLCNKNYCNSGAGFGPLGALLALCVCLGYILH